jgi:hypothetical protein
MIYPKIEVIIEWMKCGECKKKNRVTKSGLCRACWEKVGNVPIECRKCGKKSKVRRSRLCDDCYLVMCRRCGRKRKRDKKGCLCRFDKKRKSKAQWKKIRIKRIKEREERKIESDAWKKKQEEKMREERELNDLRAQVKRILDKKDLAAGKVLTGEGKWHGGFRRLDAAVDKIRFSLDRKKAIRELKRDEFFVSSHFFNTK